MTQMPHSRVLLVKPDYPGPFRGGIFAGLGYLAEVADHNGVECQVIDMGLGYQWHHLLR